MDDANPFAAPAPAAAPPLPPPRAAASPADVMRKWFRVADADRDGRINSHEAPAFFARSGLPREEMARVWMLSDPGRQGFLGPAEFVAALKYIYLAQQGREVSLPQRSLRVRAAVAVPPLARCAVEQGAQPRNLGAGPLPRTRPELTPAPRAFPTRHL